jgi:hypothetical protein
MPRKTNTTKDLAPALPVRQELLDQLVPGPLTPAQFETLFRGLKKAVLERALGAELTHHLGTEQAPGAPRRQPPQRQRRRRPYSPTRGQCGSRCRGIGAGPSSRS